MDSKQHQTLMWQQGQYMSDSGIHSGLTTHGPPSVSSKHGLDEMETGNEMDTTQMMFDFDQGFNQGFTQEQVDGDYSTNQLTILLNYQVICWLVFNTT